MHVRASRTMTLPLLVGLVLTVDLPTDVHQLALAIAETSGTTFSVAVTRLLRTAMAVPAPSRITVDPGTGFPLFSSGRPVDGGDVRAMEDEE